jgi:pimeloyl-ACP methyl ester carboxylesterase
VNAFPAVPGLDVEHRFVDAGTLRMHVAECGHGPPLVLLHGWPQHWWMWRAVLPALARRFRCLAPDLRGLGWTDAPADGYAKQQLADDVVALLDALGLDRVRLIGHDWGALTAQLVVLGRPERVVSCLSLDVPALWERGLDPRRAAGLSHTPFLAAPFAERFVPRVAEALLRRSRLTAGEREEYVQVLREPARRRATVGYYRTFVLRELPAIVASPRPRPQVPVRLVGGAGDPVVRWSPGVDLVRGAGHFLPEDDPDAVVRHACSSL